MDLYSRRALIRNAAMELAVRCANIRLNGNDPAIAVLDYPADGTRSVQQQRDELTAELIAFDLAHPAIRADLDHDYLRDEARMLRS